MWRTIGENPLAAQLRPLLDRTLVARIAAGLAEVEALFVALARETREPEPGAPAMSALYVGPPIMHLWRACGLARASDALGAGAPTAQRFRQLVELHYRDNLGVDDFARMLGVTRAHLHDGCVRTLGAAPQQLVHERPAVEARTRLRDTAQTIEQIAYSLGFRDPACFSRFFSRRSGMSPGAYRKAARIAPPREATAFAAWPDATVRSGRDDRGAPPPATSLYSAACARCPSIRGISPAPADSPIAGCLAEPVSQCERRSR